MLEEVKKSFPGEFLPTNQYGVLSLAYIGDSIYEIYVRSFLISKTDQKVNALHKQATKFVCAAAQAEFYHKIAGILTEEEQAVFHRGRNAKSHPPKNASVSDYRIATGIETLIGYLYLKDNMPRISELMRYLFD